MKKYVSLVLIVVSILVISSCGFGSKLAKESDLLRMFNEKFADELTVYFEEEAQNFELDSLKIIRRQTNEEAKSDIVDCELAIKSENFIGIVNYRLSLNYYDEGGWQLDEVENLGFKKFEPTKILPSGIDSPIHSFENCYGYGELKSETFDEESKKITRVYSYNTQSQYMSAVGDITVHQWVEISEEGYPYWQYEHADSVVKAWNLSGKYTLKRQIDYNRIFTYEDDLPKIYGVEQSGDDVGYGVHTISNIRTIEDNAVTMDVAILIRDYLSSGYITTESITLQNGQDSYEIFRNRDGDYMEIHLTPESGLTLVEYDYEYNEKDEYAFISEN